MFNSLADISELIIRGQTEPADSKTQHVAGLADQGDLDWLCVDNLKNLQQPSERSAEVICAEKGHL